MTLMRKFTLACVVAAAAAVLPTVAQAQGPANQDTYFTFSAPVELPGVTLPAGRYLFVLADSPSNRHVVRVMSDDRKKLYTTLMAIPSYMVGKPSSEPEIRFMEAPENAPNAVKLWIYPGRTTAHEFIYPRSQATRLARTMSEPVLTVKTEDAAIETAAETDMTRIDREGRDTGITAENTTLETDASAIRGSVDAEATVQASSTTSAEVPPAPAPRRRAIDRTELPATASAIPLIALIGLASLAGSAWMRRSRRSTPPTPPQI
jgi:LPXTG-motif cell wall-anchored protein